MATLRIMSWNLRTFAVFTPNAEDYRRITRIILNSCADIVCIQELQIGNGVGGAIGSPISQPSQQVVDNLVAELATADPNAGWQRAMSGVNQGFADSMRDAYGFLWKSTPGGSANAHPQPVDGITNLNSPFILRQPLSDNFPGRRPGMLVVKVTAGSTITPIDIISYHARTPANAFGKGKGAGTGVNALASLAEVGGGMTTSNGRAYDWKSTWPLPEVDTVVLGDFNYSMDQSKASLVYKNLLDSYQPCVSSPTNITYTTYSPAATQALRLVSAYDNIFVLRAHDGFTPALGFTQQFGAIDFIAAEAKLLGEALSIQTIDSATGTIVAWYVIHVDQYKNQHARRGISDHLPVWADFTIAAGGATASQIKPTSSTGANGLLDAAFGTVAADGLYTDNTADQHRADVVSMLRGYATSQAFPTAGNVVPVQSAVLKSMLATLGADPAASQLLAQLLDSTANPFGSAGFSMLYDSYVNAIAGGRPFAESDVDLVADLLNITITVMTMSGAHYLSVAHNPGAPSMVTVLSQAGNFFRWQ